MCFCYTENACFRKCCYQHELAKVMSIYWSYCVFFKTGPFFSLSTGLHKSGTRGVSCWNDQTCRSRAETQMMQRSRCFRCNHPNLLWSCYFTVWSISLALQPPSNYTKSQSQQWKCVMEQLYTYPMLHQWESLDPLRREEFRSLD